MAVDILLAAVGEGEQLPGGCYDVAGGSTGAFFASADQTAIPDLGTGDFDILAYFRPGNASTNAYLWTARVDNNNYVSIARRNDNLMEFRWVTGGSTRVSLIPASFGTYSSHCVALITRRGNDFRMDLYQGAGTTTLGLVTATATISAGDTFTSSIRTASGRLRIGHFDGSTNGFKWVGAWGLIAVIKGANASMTDDERKLYMLDPQRMFSYFGYDPSNVTAYGNWADSSGNLKTAITRTQFAASDRIVCPFSGNYLTLGAGSAQSTELACPPYTMPAHTDPIIAHRGSWNYLDCPFALEHPAGGWITTRTQKDANQDPTFYVDFLDAAGALNRWPVAFPWGYDVDGTWYWNAMSGTGHKGDTHTACPLFFAHNPDGSIKALVLAPYLHSSVYADTPGAGQTTKAIEQFVVLTDAALPQTIKPTGAETKTYSLITQRAFRSLISSRIGAAATAQLLISEFDHADYAVRRKNYMTHPGDSERRNYPGPIVNMSDGRSITFPHMVSEEDGILTNSAIIIPPAADFADNSKWFTPTGKNLGGSNGIGALGTINQVADFADLALTDDNAAFFASLPLPDGGTGMDHVRLEQPCHVAGEFEGIAAIVRVSSGNGDLATLVSNSSGGASAEFDETTLRRWTYTSGSAPTLVFRDSFDLTSIIAELNPGQWPQNTAATTAECQYLHCCQFGGNRMLMFVNDPESVAIGTSKSVLGSLMGFTLKGVLFNKLDAADPRDYIEFVDVVHDIATDNSEGYGLMPYSVGNGNDGSKSVIVVIAGGDWVAQGWGNRVVKGIDLRTSLRTTLAANNQLPRRRQSELLGI